MLVVQSKILSASHTVLLSIKCCSGHDFIIGRRKFVKQRKCHRFIGDLPSLVNQASLIVLITFHYPRIGNLVNLVMYVSLYRFSTQIRHPKSQWMWFPLQPMLTLMYHIHIQRCTAQLQMSPCLLTLSSSRGDGGHY